MPITPAEELLENQYSESKLNGAPISLFTASGPYTVDSDLGYAPFQALIDEVNKSRPDVLILVRPHLFLPSSALVQQSLTNGRSSFPCSTCLPTQLGPFVDSSHPLLRVGATTLTPLEIFHSKIRSPLQTVLESCPQTTIILVPSVRDLLNEQMAFPQAMFSREKLEVSKVRCRDSSLSHLKPSLYLLDRN
jgi:DNA polymerase alpha subunit B